MKSSTAATPRPQPINLRVSAQGAESNGAWRTACTASAASPRTLPRLITRESRAARTRPRRIPSIEYASDTLAIYRAVRVADPTNRPRTGRFELHAVTGDAAGKGENLIWIPWSRNPQAAPPMHANPRSPASGDPTHCGRCDEWHLDFLRVVMPRCGTLKP